MSKALLDTNVLIYSTNYDSRYYSEITNFLSETTLELCTTSKNLSEYLSVVTRIPSKPLRFAQALDIVETFMHNFEILYPSSKSFSLFMKLLQKYEPAGLKIHDFEILSISLSNDINSIITFNRKDFRGIEEIKLIELKTI